MGFHELLYTVIHMKISVNGVYECELVSVLDVNVLNTYLI